MEELEELGKGRQVKNSHLGASSSPPPLPHTDPRHSVCPSPNLHTQSLGGETCPTSHGCLSLTQHIEF